jgi:hypothetical protein
MDKLLKEDHETLNKSISETALLNTIYIPKNNLMLLTERLPRPNYEETPKKTIDSTIHQRNINS